MELKLRDGKYVPAGDGGLERISGGEAAIQRALLRLMTPRGSFPVLPSYGSRLHTLCRLKPGERSAAAVQYVLEALEPERNMTVNEVQYSQTGDGSTAVYVSLSSGNTALGTVLRLETNEV